MSDEFSVISPKKQVKRKISLIRVPVALHTELKRRSKKSGKLLDTVNKEVILAGLAALNN